MKNEQLVKHDNKTVNRLVGWVESICSCETPVIPSDDSQKSVGDADRVGVCVRCQGIIADVSPGLVLVRMVV